MEHLSQHEWEKALATDSQAVIIDVRTPEEYDMGRIENAINLDIFELDNFIKQLNEFDKEKSYYLYCQAGGRSSTACKLMEDKGFKKTYNLIGGIVCWGKELTVKA